MALMPERSNRMRAFCAALMILAAAGCGDDGTDPEPEPEIATIRVTVGTSTPVNVNTTAEPWVYSGTISLRVNQANQVTFQFLGADGQDEPIIAAERADIELRMTNLAAGWTFSATGGSGATFTANITPTQTGTFIPVLQLFHTEHGHNEVDHTLNVTVTQ
jgi:hypothetical protein